MNRFKHVLAIITVLMMTFGSISCGISRNDSGSGRSSRSSRTDDSEERNTGNNDDDVLEVETDFGSFQIGHGWSYVPTQSAPPERYTYCDEDDIEDDDDGDAPNNLLVMHGTNYYGIDEGDEFCTAILQQIHGQAAMYNGTAAMTEYGTFGENQVYRFDMLCDELDCYQWYVVGDHEYIMFSLMVFDRDDLEDDHALEVAEDAVYSFVWNR